MMRLAWGKTMQDDASSQYYLIRGLTLVVIDLALQYLIVDMSILSTAARRILSYSHALT